MTAFRKAKCKDPNLSWASLISHTNFVLQKTRTHQMRLCAWLSGARSAGLLESIRKDRSASIYSSAMARPCCGIALGQHHKTCSETVAPRCQTWCDSHGQAEKLD